MGEQWYDGRDVRASGGATSSLPGVTVAGRATSMFTMNGSLPHSSVAQPERHFSRVAVSTNCLRKSRRQTTGFMRPDKAVEPDAAGGRAGKGAAELWLTAECKGDEAPNQAPRGASGAEKERKLMILNGSAVARQPAGRRHRAASRTPAVTPVALPCASRLRTSRGPAVGGAGASPQDRRRAARDRAGATGPWRAALRRIGPQAHGLPRGGRRP